MTAPIPPFPVAALVGIQQAGERAGWDEEVGVWVCTEHKRFIPCRICDREPWRTILPHSCDPQDVEIVRKYQQPDTEPEDN